MRAHSADNGRSPVRNSLLVNCLHRRICDPPSSTVVQLVPKFLHVAFGIQSPVTVDASISGLYQMHSMPVHNFRRMLSLAFTFPETRVHVLGWAARDWPSHAAA